MKKYTHIELLFALIFSIILLFSACSCASSKPTISQWVVVSVSKDGKTFRAANDRYSAIFLAQDSVWIGKLVNVSIGK